MSILFWAQRQKETDTALILPIENWYNLQKKLEVIAPQVLKKITRTLKR